MKKYIIIMILLFSLTGCNTDEKIATLQDENDVLKEKILETEDEITNLESKFFDETDINIEFVNKQYLVADELILNFLLNNNTDERIVSVEGEMYFFNEDGKLVESFLTDIKNINIEPNTQDMEYSITLDIDTTNIEDVYFAQLPTDTLSFEFYPTAIYKE